MSKSLAIINSKAPYSLADGKEALDLALIFGSYERDVALFFIGDGVWQLSALNDASSLSIKDYLKTFDALHFYDIERIYVSQEALTERKLDNIKTIEGLSVIPDAELSEKLNEFHQLLRF